MIDYIIPLVAWYLSSGLAQYFFFPFIALAFLAFVPGFIRALFGGH